MMQHKDDDYCIVLKVSVFNLASLFPCFRLKQKWVEITTDTQVDVLIDAVTNGVGSSASDIIRTMVFVNTVEAAEAVAKILTRAGITCLRYHREVSLEERTDNIATFQQEGGIFVCTDAAARGLDVPNVSHVIQVCLFFELGMCMGHVCNFRKLVIG